MSSVFPSFSPLVWVVILEKRFHIYITFWVTNWWVFTSGSCLNPRILPHADKYPKHFKTVEAFSQVFEPNALRKQFQNKAELILDASRGHFKSRGSEDSVQYFTLRGLSQLAAEFLDPTVRGRWSARIRMWSLHEQLTHFNWMQLFIVFSWCNKIFLFIISYIKYKTRIFVWIQTLQSSTWPFFSNASSNQESLTVTCCNI